MTRDTELTNWNCETARSQNWVSCKSISSIVIIAPWHGRYLSTNNLAEVCVRKIGLNADYSSGYQPFFHRQGSDVWLVSSEPETCLGLCVVSYYAEHDHYHMMDCRGMMMVTPVIMGTSAGTLIEWKKIYNTEKSILSQGWNLRNSGKNHSIPVYRMVVYAIWSLVWFKLLDCFHTVLARLGQAKMVDWWLDKLSQVQAGWCCSVKLNNQPSHLINKIQSKLFVLLDMTIMGSS